MATHRDDRRTAFKTEMDTLTTKARRGETPSREEVERLGLLGLLELAQCSRPSVRARALRDLLTLYGIDPSGRAQWDADRQVGL